MNATVNTKNGNLQSHWQDQLYLMFLIVHIVWPRPDRFLGGAGRLGFVPLGSVGANKT